MNSDSLNTLKKETKLTARDFLQFLRNLAFGVILGAGVGAYSALFGLLLVFVTNLRGTYPWLLLLLPFAGLVIAGLYYICGGKNPKGTNRVIASISSGENLPLLMGPLITISTLITHMFGGSAGREGAALQIGGTYGYWFGRLFKLDSKDLIITTMCGMSAAFSSLFGTPIAATVFSMELISVGIMHYSAFVPCAVSSIVGFELSKIIGVAHESFTDIVIADFGWLMCLKVVLLGIACAVLSIIFVYTLHRGEHEIKRFIPNTFTRIAVGGFFVILFTMIIGTTDYEGAGMDIVAAALEGSAVPYAFILKILLTAITLGVGFKGGEIVPSIFIGATFGCVFGPLIGIPASTAACLCVCGMFCAVTNCPITALLLAFELFGLRGIPYFLIIAAVSYRLSGYYGLYSGQKIIYSKSEPSFINWHSDKE